MRMGDGDGVNAAESAHGRDGWIVNQAYAVPQQVSGRRLNEKRSLPNRKLGVHPYAGQSGLDAFDHRMMIALKLRQRSPLLSVGSDVLALIITNWAGKRCFFTGGELRSARLADKVSHVIPPATTSYHHTLKTQA
jgi:hypothetical protein